MANRRVADVSAGKVDRFQWTFTDGFAATGRLRTGCPPPCEVDWLKQRDGLRKEIPRILHIDDLLPPK